MAEQQSPAEEESNILRDELERVEGLLSGCRKECNIIGTKYQELSDKVEDILKLQSEDTDQDDSLTNELVEHHKELRQNLEEELNKYRQHVSSYQHSQAEQSKMIDELHNKVEEYRIRCAKLEAALAENSVQGSLHEQEAFNTNDNVVDLQTALIKLEQEKNRCHGLNQINNLLREQLETATEANQILTADIHRLMQEWQCTREELDAKEIEWKDEELSFSDYFTKEHHRLLALWRQLLHFRHEFAIMRSSTERDLSSVRTHITQASRNVTQACLRFRTSQPSESSSTEDMVETEVSWEVQQLHQEMVAVQLQCDSEKAELHDRVRILELSNDRNEELLEEKDRKIHKLQRTIENMERRGVDGSPSKRRHSSSNKYEEELRRYQKAIRDIAQSISDDFSHETWARLRHEGVPDFGCYQLPGSPGQPYFLDGTVSAVAAAFEAHRLQAEEIHKMFKHQKERVDSQERMIDRANREIDKWNDVNTKFQTKMETMEHNMTGMMTEANEIRSAVQAAEAQKDEYIRLKKIWQARLESLSVDKEKLREDKAKLREVLDHSRQTLEMVDNERERLQAAEFRLLRDLEKSFQRIADLQEKIEILKKEAQSSQEKSQELSLDNEILQQEKKKMGHSLNKLNDKCTALQEQLDKLHAQEESLTNSIESLENINESLKQENTELSKSLIERTEEVTELEARIFAEKTTNEKEKQEMKEQIEKLESYSHELETERNMLKETVQAAETSKHDNEEEKSKIIIQNNDLLNQITKLKNQKKILETEQEHLRTELARQIENCEKTSLENDALAREKAELLVRAETAEKELELLSDTESVLKEEKEVLEKSLYESQHLCGSLNGKIEELERELENEKSRVLSLQEVLSMIKDHKEFEAETAARQKDALSQKIHQLEQEYRAILQNERHQHKIEMGVFSQEKESQLTRLQAAQEDLIKTVQGHQDELITNHEREIADMKNQFLAQQREYEEKLMASQTEQKRAATVSNLSISALQQKIKEIQKDLSDSQNKAEQDKKRFSATEDHYNSIISELQGQVSRLKEEIKNNAISHEKSMKEINNQLIEAKQQKESVYEEIAQLKEQQNDSEKEYESLKQELKELTVFKENAKAIHDQLEEQITDLQQQLTHEKGLKQIERKASDEYKKKFKKTQMEYDDLVQVYEDTRKKLEAAEKGNSLSKKDSNELKNTLREVEQSRLDAKHQIRVLRRKLADLDSSIHSKNREIAELRDSHARKEDREARCRKEISSLKQQLMVSEAAYEAASKEMSYLIHKLSDCEHELKLKQEEHQAALQENMSTERLMHEQRAAVESSLADARTEVQKLRLSLNFAEGKVQALESKVSKLEGAKLDVESKLYQIHQALRLNLGLGSDSSLMNSTHLLLSPWSSRRSSPVKSKDRSFRESTPVLDSGSKEGSPLRQVATWSASDLDVDLVKSALQDFVQRLLTAEKERDDLKGELMKLQLKLDKNDHEKNEYSTRVQNMKKDLKAINRDKKELKNELESVRTQHERQNETILALERDHNVLLEKINRLEQSVASLTSEKHRLQESVTQLEKAEAEYYRERQSLIEAREAAESRALASDVSLSSCESEKNRLQSDLSSKESEVEMLQQRLDRTSQHLDSLENINRDLEKKLHQLHQANQRYADSENQLQEKINVLNVTLSETSSTLVAMEGDCNSVKKKLQACNKEKCNLQHSLEKLRGTVNEYKSENSSLSDQVRSLQKDLKSSELKQTELSSQISSYESMISQSQSSEQEAIQRIQRLEQERATLREQISSSNISLRRYEEQHSELEKQYHRLEKDHAALQKSLDKVEKERLKTAELANRSVQERSELGNSLATLEAENRDLLRKVSDLKGQLAEVEERHSQRLKEIKDNQRHELRIEFERLKDAHKQTQEAVESRDKAYRQQIATLTQQVETLKAQVALEKRRFQCEQRTAQNEYEIRYLKDVMNTSMRNVIENPDKKQEETHLLHAVVSREIAEDPSIILTTPSRMTRPASPKVASTSRAKRRLDTAFHS